MQLAGLWEDSGGAIVDARSASSGARTNSSLANVFIAKGVSVACSPFVQKLL